MPHMFHKRRLLQEKLNTLNRIAVEEPCVIIVAKVISIVEIFVIHFTWYAGVNA